MPGHRLPVNSRPNFFLATGRADSLVELPMSKATPSNEVAVLKTSYGEMTLSFWPDVAPKTVENFKKLAREGFYDGTAFHRIIKGFMIQGGDPNSKDDDLNNDGTGGTGEKLKAEFNDIKHARGICSMARTQDPNSATSQFFICHGDASFLDHQYTVWGQLLSGYDVLDKIEALPRVQGDNPGKAAVMTKVYIEGK